MNDKAFTDELFQRMYNLGFNKAEIEDDVLFFFKNERDLLCPFSPRVMVACTCFEEKDQLIDMAEYLNIVDWSKVAIDTPILVRNSNQKPWIKRYFASFENDKVRTWDCGSTSWSNGDIHETSEWMYAKLAEV